MLGLSRTFKTPLSIYLAFKGWMVANVLIIMDLQPPEILNIIPGKRVFCLTALAHRLAALRSIRDSHLGGATGDYADPSYVRREIQFALDFYKKHPNWYIIEVTNKPIEEIASAILSVIRKRERS